MVELKLLKLLSKKELFNKYYSGVKDRLLTEEAAIILRNYNNYFKDKPAIDVIDFNDFIFWFKQIENPTWKEEKHREYESIFKEINGVYLTKEDEENILQLLLTRSYAIKIADSANSVADGSNTDLDIISQHLDNYTSECVKIDKLSWEDNLVTDDLEELCKHTTRPYLLKWSLSALQKSLGSIGQGDFLVFGGRPDSGKTSLVAYEAVRMAPQIPDGRPVLWFNNEEEKGKVRLRTVSAALGVSKETILANPPKYRDLYQKALGGKNKLIIVDGSWFNEEDLLKPIRHYNPGLIVIDQFKKIEGKRTRRGSTEADQTAANAAFLRGLAKEFCPILTTIWADQSAAGVEYIEMSQLYGSKTGVQGEADAVVCIGRNFNPGEEKNRFINIPKNKLDGEDPSERNGKHVLLIDGMKAQFKESV